VNDRQKMMDRLEKAQREEERWQFSQQAGLFEGVFSRRIFGPLWWWWLFVVYFLSILLTTEPGRPFSRSFYMAAILLAASTVWIAAILLPKERRTLWFSRQRPVSVPIFARVGLHAIPWLGLCAIVWCALAR
jgi:hypothetical protein